MVRRGNAAKSFLAKRMAEATKIRLTVSGASESIAAWIAHLAHGRTLNTRVTRVTPMTGPGAPAGYLPVIAGSGEP